MTWGGGPPGAYRQRCLCRITRVLANAATRQLSCDKALARFARGDTPYPSQASPLRYTILDVALADTLGRMLGAGGSLHRCNVAPHCMQCSAMLAVRARCNDATMRPQTSRS